MIRVTSNAPSEFEQKPKDSANLEDRRRADLPETSEHPPFGNGPGLEGNRCSADGTGARRISVFLEDDFREPTPGPGSCPRNDLNLKLHTRRLTVLHRLAHQSSTVWTLSAILISRSTESPSTSRAS